MGCRRRLEAVARGFSLIELMVVISIFGILTSILVYKNSDFNNTILLTNVAYEVALTIRQAQVYGVNVSSAGGANFRSGYGVNINMASADQMTLFSDQFVGNAPEGDYIYDSSELLSQINFTRGYSIKGFCLKNLSAGGNQDCFTNGSSAEVAIVFVRPNPDAHIRYKNGNTTVEYDQIEITITTQDGTKTKTVLVTNTGQITIQ